MQIAFPLIGTSFSTAQTPALEILQKSLCRFAESLKTVCACACAPQQVTPPSTPRCSDAGRGTLCLIKHEEKTI